MMMMMMLLLLSSHEKSKYTALAENDLCTVFLSRKTLSFEIARVV